MYINVTRWVANELNEAQCSLMYVKFITISNVYCQKDALMIAGNNQWSVKLYTKIEYLEPNSSCFDHSRWHHCQHQRSCLLHNLALPMEMFCCFRVRGMPAIKKHDILISKDKAPIWNNVRVTHMHHFLFTHRYHHHHHPLVVLAKIITYCNLNSIFFIQYHVFPCHIHRSLLTQFRLYGRM